QVLQRLDHLLAVDQAVARHRHRARALHHGDDLVDPLERVHRWSTPRSLFGATVVPVVDGVAVPAGRGHTASHPYIMEPARHRSLHLIVPRRVVRPPRFRWRSPAGGRATAGPPGPARAGSRHRPTWRPP